MNKLSVTTLLFLASTAVTAHANVTGSPDVERAIALGDSMSGSARAKSQSWLVAPKGTYVIGGRLRFLNSDATPFSDEAAKMTDLALFDVTARASLGSELELGLGMSVLAKEITGTDESVFQGGFASLRVGLAKWAAIDLGSSARPLIADQGWILNPAAALVFRGDAHRFLRFTGGVAGVWNNLFINDQDRLSFGEVGVHGEIVFPIENNFAAWAGSDYRVPLSGKSSGAMELDPQPRLGVRAGCAFTFVPQWNLFAEYSIIDRGDLQRPATTLPVIDGGFDQRQLIIGVSRRFHDTDPDRLRD